jgi:hypothetical protein
VVCDLKEQIKAAQHFIEIIPGQITDYLRTATL